MSRLVLDSSIVIKWFVPEVHSADALRYLDPDLGRDAPELLLAEVSNILWKKVCRGELSEEQAVSIAHDVGEADIKIHPTSGILTSPYTMSRGQQGLRRPLKILRFDKQVVRIKRGYDKNGDACFRQWVDQRSQYPNDREIKPSLHPQAPPAALTFGRRRHVFFRADDRKLFGRPCHRR